MRKIASLAVAAALLLTGVSSLAAQDADKPGYLDTTLTPEQRAADLVKRMTLEEKATQLVNQARAIPRLKVPAYDWWSESLHGVAVKDVTEFPEPVGLASTFDTDAIHHMGEIISTEARIKHVQALKKNGGSSNIFEGLDFWAPNINIFRDPRWGRGQETYGEDPFLTGRMGVAFVTGMQGDDPKYYRVIATPKHYAVHSGPEPTRHFADVDVSKHDQMDTYLPAFRAAITEGKAGSIMCSYNSINGQPGCASQFQLVDQLRNKWGFQGYVVSDCGAVIDIFNGHHYRPTQAQASAISLIRGMDNECADFGKVSDNHDYKPYIDAVQQGYLPESDVDTALIRLFTARMKLGMFDPPETVPYTKIDEKLLESTEHRNYARKVAEESMVLLKNDGVLPLKPEVKNIAVVGPLADQTKVLLGNYNGTPSHIVSLLDGLKAEFPNAKITYAPGTQFLRPEDTLMPANLLTTPDGKPGLKAEYGEGMGFETKPKPITDRVESNVNLTESSIPAEAKSKDSFSVQWTGFITATETGDYVIGINADGFAAVRVNDKPVAQGWGAGLHTGRIHLIKGEKAALSVTYGHQKEGKFLARLIWNKYDPTPSPAAVEAARKADVVIAAVGITSDLEGEEMPVSEPGFLGGDRTSIDMPQPEEDLVQAVAKAGKPLVVVLMNGSALAVNWEKEHANAILEAWYSGEEGGSAIAATLSGKNNPAGRLPVTFYTGVDQLPHFEDYSMSNRTYRYFHGKPLYPFGYGLSYTTFAYKDLTIPADLKAGEPLSADVTVTNTGKLAGDEVAQLYLTFPSVPGAPIRALRAFKRVHLEAGESQKVHFDLKPRDLGMVSEAGDPLVSAGEYTVTIGGGQPGTDAPNATAKLKINGSLSLPE
ncbi:glycoside hydrolase family 3 C-terminal domain-containing protein [Occallatibacter riparius]|uniref:Glycoside hydrolase family 3 C-terminal domain-containing protein n=1 Tax=Occallatibacter riparius TaxID=1002689 RepID=A0A9J7BWB2_9BACT|nr:glycoside hydrolase family 3 C-terminal domain-containing protein [Occallatibacter riparius]UWZ86098.1 glycoside hydrolase family 3 C-terminal domain-containing protein [Occallatibacter riparius]